MTTVVIHAQEQIFVIVPVNEDDFEGIFDETFDETFE